MGKGLLEGLVSGVLGGKPLAAVEKVLGTPDGGGVTGFESAVAAGVGRAYVAADSTSPTNASDSPPYSEIIVPYSQIAGPFQVSQTGVSNATYTLPPYQVNIGGHFLRLKRSGTSPGASFIVNVGSVLHVLQPGMIIQTKFSSFSIVRRMFATNIDVNNSYPYFVGEAQFVVGREPGDFFQEAEAPLAPPFYRPIECLGSLNLNLNAASAPGWQFMVSDSTALGANLIYFAASGAKNLRLYIASYPSTQSYDISAPPYVATNDSVFFEIYGYPASYKLDSILTMQKIPAGIIPLRVGTSNTEILTTQPFLWNSNLIRIYDFALQGSNEIYQLFYKNTTQPNSGIFVILEGWG